MMAIDKCFVILSLIAIVTVVFVTGEESLSTTTTTTTTTLTQSQLGSCYVSHSTAESVTLHWQPARSAAVYTVLNGSTQINTTSSSVTIYGLTPGSVYTFQLFAIWQNGLTSNTINCTDSTDPEKPTAPNVTNVKNDALTLSWSTRRTKVVNSTYVWFRDVTTSVTLNWVSISVPDGNAVYIVTGLTPGHTYEFKIEVKSFGKSAVSETVSETTAPVIYGSCSWINSTTNSTTFSWDLARSAAVYTVLNRSIQINTTSSLITIHGLTPGSRYTFPLFAVGHNGLTSNIVNCTNSTEPATPNVTVREVEETKITVELFYYDSSVINSTTLYYRDVTPGTSSSSSFKKDRIASRGTKHVIQRLLPGNKYQIYVEVQSFNKKASSPHIFQYTYTTTSSTTAASSPQPPPRVKPPAGCNRFKRRKNRKKCRKTKQRLGKLRKRSRRARRIRKRKG